MILERTKDFILIEDLPREYSVVCLSCIMAVFAPIAEPKCPNCWKVVPKDMWQKFKVLTTLNNL